MVGRKCVQAQSQRPNSMRLTRDKLFRHLHCGQCVYWVFDGAGASPLLFTSVLLMQVSNGFASTELSVVSASADESECRLQSTKSAVALGDCRGERASRLTRAVMR